MAKVNSKNSGEDRALLSQLARIVHLIGKLDAVSLVGTGRRTLLLTHSIETLGQMSCNPSIGGIGKGHLVKEVDALAGAMAIATDEAGIQFRILNASRGPAVRATRAQADRVLYKQAIRRRLESESSGAAGRW